MVLDYVRSWVPEARKAPLAGNTVGTDRLFLTRDMPMLEAYLHYRIVDVSSIKELVAPVVSRAPTSPRPAKGGNHRALADIQESIEELRYYRAAVFVPPPGPTPRRLASWPPSTADRSPSGAEPRGISTARHPLHFSSRGGAIGPASVPRWV